jgi:hypothetical protein
MNFLRRLLGLPEPVETRASGFTAEVIQMREAYISGARGIGELTATAQTCVSLWESGLSLADVSGTDLLDPFTRAAMARSLALRGEAVMLIRDRLVPCSDWDLRTRNGRPTAYRLSIPEAGGEVSVTALAAEVLHVRIGCDPAAPWIGQAPLRRAQITAALLHAVESALCETFEAAPIGSQIVHLPEGAPDDMQNMRAAFRARRGSVLVVEGMAQSAAAGLHPSIGQRPDDLTPNLKDSMSVETLEAARDAVALAFGVLPGLLNRAVTGPVVREAHRHLATWTLQPVAELIAAEASEKLGAPVKLDTLRPVQAWDTGGRARALGAIVQAMAAAKAEGIDIGPALELVNWQEGDRT